MLRVMRLAVPPGYVPAERDARGRRFKPLPPYQAGTQLLQMLRLSRHPDREELNCLLECPSTKQYMDAVRDKQKEAVEKIIADQHYQHSWFRKPSKPLGRVDDQALVEMHRAGLLTSGHLLDFACDRCSEHLLSAAMEAGTMPGERHLRRVVKLQASQLSHGRHAEDRLSVDSDTHSMGAFLRRLCSVPEIQAVLRCEDGSSCVGEDGPAAAAAAGAGAGTPDSGTPCEFGAVVAASFVLACQCSRQGELDAVQYIEQWRRAGLRIQGAVLFRDIEPYWREQLDVANRDRRYSPLALAIATRRAVLACYLLMLGHRLDPNTDSDLRPIVRSRLRWYEQV